jgi:hypothetical protein
MSNSSTSAQQAFDDIIILSSDDDGAPAVTHENRGKAKSESSWPFVNIITHFYTCRRAKDTKGGSKLSLKRSSYKSEKSRASKLILVERSVYPHERLLQQVAYLQTRLRSAPSPKAVAEVHDRTLCAICASRMWCPCM